MSACRRAAKPRRERTHGLRAEASRRKEAARAGAPSRLSRRTGRCWGRGIVDCAKGTVAGQPTPISFFDMSGGGKGEERERGLRLTTMPPANSSAAARACGRHPRLSSIGNPGVGVYGVHRRTYRAGFVSTAGLPAGGPADYRWGCLWLRGARAPGMFVVFGLVPVLLETPRLDGGAQILVSRSEGPSLGR